MNKFIGGLQVTGVFILLMFPYLWQGKEVQVNVWDNLDSNVVWYKMLKDQDKIYAGPEVKVEGFVTSTPRFSYPSGINVEAFLFYALTPFDAYWVNKLTIILLAFLGMIMLFSDHYRSQKWEVIAIGLLWASLAYNPHIGISIAGLPLLLWSFLNLKENKHKIISLLCLIVYSFYSSFILVGVFTLLLLLLLLTYWWIKAGKFPKNASLGFVVLVVCYSVQEYNLIYYLFFQEDFVSHRREMDYRFNTFHNHSPWYFVKNGNHNSVFYWWGYVLIIYSLLLLLWFHRKGGLYFNKLQKSEKTLVILAAALSIVLPLLTSFLSWSHVINLTGKLIPMIHSFNLLRMAFLIPFFLFLILGYALIYFKIRYKKVLVALLLAINIFIYQFEWRNMLNNRLRILDYQIPTYSQYYATKQFDEIKSFLGKDWNIIKVGSINLPPGVSTYNGFKGIDGYLPLYDLSYKQDFRKIIQGELEKDKDLYEHFQYWGNKCYIQNATYPDMFDAYKWKNLDPIEQLNLDFNVIKERFNAEYIFSAVELHHERLPLLKLFTHQESAWDIYLYKVN